jgi:hypothetical protein
MPPKRMLPTLEEQERLAKKPGTLFHAWAPKEVRISSCSRPACFRAQASIIDLGPHPPSPPFLVLVQDEGFRGAAAKSVGPSDMVSMMIDRGM